MPAAKKVKPEEVEAAKGVNALTVYFFAIVNRKRFPAQQTLTCDNVEDFTRLLPDFYGMFVPDEEEEAAFVTYEPRSIGPAQPAARPAAGEAPSPGQRQEDRVQGPLCPIHGTPTTQKNGRNGPFFSCSRRKEDNSWCNWTPVEPQA